MNKTSETHAEEDTSQHEDIDDLEPEDIGSSKAAVVEAKPGADAPAGSVPSEELEVDGAGDDDDEDNAGYEENAEREEIIRERINRTQDQMRVIVESMSEDQVSRYERFRRTHLSRQIMEKWMQRVLDQKVHANCVIITTGIAKVFVGQLIEGAREVMEGEIRGFLEATQPQLTPEQIEDEVLNQLAARPIEPFHIMESHRRMQQDDFTAPLPAACRKPCPFS